VAGEEVVEVVEGRVHLGHRHLPRLARVPWAWIGLEIGVAAMEAWLEMGLILGRDTADFITPSASSTRVPLTRTGI
jgi:hypothetical protein